MQSNRLSELMTLTCGGQLERPLTRTQETIFAVIAIGAALALSSIWGIAAGSSSAALAMQNAFEVPMVILLSAITALPAGLVALRLTNAKLAAHELAGAFALAIFGGTLVLATLAPIVAIYYHTSSEAGVPIALGSVFVALGTATLLFGRAVARRVLQNGGEKAKRAASLLAVVVLVTLFIAALLQYVALVSPIIGDAGTRFDGGFDGVFGR